MTENSQKKGGVSQLQKDRADRNRDCENSMCERLQGIRNGLGYNEWCSSKKKRQNKLYGEHTGGASTTGICGERIPDGRTSPDCIGERLQRTDFNTKAVILGIIDPEGYDKENRVYSGGGCVLPC